MTIQFLNVDLEIEHHLDIKAIVEDFGENVFNLYYGKIQDRYLASFELHDVTDVDSTISSFCTLIKAMDNESKELWDTAYSKVFDVGYESGLEPNNYSSEIQADTIDQVAKLGASLKITIYPPLPK